VGKSAANTKLAVKIAETKVRLRILGIMLTISLPFGLDSFEQLGVGSFKLVSKLHSCLESFGIHLEPFSQFLGGWIVKERNVLVEIRHDQFVA
jgi:hypothetical protein